jgi:hypothetical protein
MSNRRMSSARDQDSLYLGSLMMHTTVRALKLDGHQIQNTGPLNLVKSSSLVQSRWWHLSCYNKVLSRSRTKVAQPSSNVQSRMTAGEAINAAVFILASVSNARTSSTVCYPSFLIFLISR